MKTFKIVLIVILYLISTTLLAYETINLLKFLGANMITIEGVLGVYLGWYLFGGLITLAIIVLIITKKRDR